MCPSTGSPTITAVPTELGRALCGGNRRAHAVAAAETGVRRFPPPRRGSSSARPLCWVVCVPRPEKGSPLSEVGLARAPHAVSAAGSSDCTQGAVAAASMAMVSASWWPNQTMSAASYYQDRGCAGSPHRGWQGRAGSLAVEGALPTYRPWARGRGCAGRNCRVGPG
jgi:hypothetical protein